MLSIPRIQLPPAVADQLAEFDLKNPNELSDSEYNTYSGAAIGGTLALMIPGALLLFDVSGFIADFLFGALVGGGLCAYFALRKDQASEYANKFGATVLSAADKLGNALG